MRVIGGMEHVAAGEARTELLRVLASPDFAASRQLTQFLQYIVAESLAGRSESLKERTVARGALGRGADFDPRLDCVVRVMAGKLRRSLERYYTLEGATDPVCIEVPKGCYCPVFRRRQAARPGEAANGAAAAVAGGESAAPRAIVAVVPLTSFTGGEKERFVADLLVDDVAVRLGRLGGLEVIDCLANGAHCTRDLCETALRLHATFVFGGSVSRVGRHVRLTVRLIDGHNGVLAWADQYDRPIENGHLTEPDDIADQIVSAIGDFFGVS